MLGAECAKRVEERLRVESEPGSKLDDHDLRLQPASRLGSLAVCIERPGGGRRSFAVARDEMGDVP